MTSRVFRNTTCREPRYTVVISPYLESEKNFFLEADKAFEKNIFSEPSLKSLREERPWCHSFVSLTLLGFCGSKNALNPHKF